MTRLISFFTCFCLSTISYGQSNFCLTDTSSIAGQILQGLKTEGIAGLIVTNKKTGQKYQGYRICEHHYLLVDSLNQILTTSQIDSLLTCDNGTLKTVGFILYSKRHNDKVSVTQKLKEMLSQEYIVMTSSCSDAIQMSSLGRLSYGLLTKPNFLFKPNFKLTKKDKALIDLDLSFYERPMTSN